LHNQAAEHDLPEPSLIEKLKPFRKPGFRAVKGSDTDAPRVQVGFTFDHADFVGGAFIRHEIQLLSWGRRATNDALLFFGEIDLKPGSDPKPVLFKDQGDHGFKGIHRTITPSRC
jgi:hypothetical protein